MASRSALLTVLFTDIVGSTEIADELGDRRWQDLLSRHHRIVRRELRRLRGREVDTAGDGFFAVFDRPEDAVRCAAAISDAVRELGIEIRAGVHAGQVELTGRRVGGVAVHVGARIGAAAGPGEVLVSETLRDLLPGAVLSFEDRGPRQLKGVAKPQNVYAISALQGQPRAGALDEDEARRRRRALAAVEAPSHTARRRRAVLVGAATLAVASAVVVAIRVADDDRGSPAPVAGGTLGAAVLIDPETNRAVRTFEGLETNVPLFTAPEVEVGEGGVWILGRGGLRHLDPTSGAITRISLETVIPTDMALAQGRMWVAIGEANRVIAVSPGALDVTDVIRLTTTPSASFGSSSIAVTSDAVWAAASERSLVRIDPASGAVRSFAVPSSADDVAGADEDVWVVSQLDDTLIRFDGTELRVAQRVELQSVTPGEMAAGADGSLWILDTFAQSVTELSATGELGRPIPVGGDPTGIAVAEDAVWVSDGDGHVVRRIDPDLGRVVATVDVGGPAGALDVDDETGDVWVYLVSAGP